MGCVERERTGQVCLERGGEDAVLNRVVRIGFLVTLLWAKS